MQKVYCKINKTVIFFIIIIFILPVFSLDVKGDKVYEYELSSGESQSKKALSELYESLPEEIKKELPESREDFSEYNIEFFEEKIRGALREAVKPATKTAAMLLFIVISASLFNMLATTVAGEGLRGAFSFCSLLCIALSIYSAMESVFKTASALLKSLCDTMLLMIPAMEAVYISSGNLTTAAVSSSGINIMIGFCQILYSKVLSPCVYAVFILAIAGVITKNNGIVFMTKNIKGLVTGAVIVIMTLMTFVLALQSGGCASQDTFTQKTLKFAISNYLPIVGSTVADSFSVLSGSLSVIRQGCGIGGIAAIIIAFLPPFAKILLSRISVGFCGAMASVLGCSREGELISECSGICTLLIAICSGACVMYIIALGIFCRLPLAVG